MRKAQADPDKQPAAQVTVYQAKTHLSRILRRVATGEEFVIAIGDKPVARLVPFREPAARRILGQERGRIWVADDFDDLSEDVLQAFEG